MATMKRKLGGWDLEFVIKGSHDIGEGMAFIDTPSGGMTILNKATGVFRQFSTAGSVLVTDDEIDFAAMEKFRHFRRISRALNYGGLGWLRPFKNGVTALSWCIYPDGMYFADSDGYGMEDNRKEVAYCIINRNLDIIVPFQPMVDVHERLEECGLWLQSKIRQCINPNFA